MGQLKSLMSTPRVEFDENGENGLLVADKYIPEELLSEILFHVDHETLLNCQLVCKRWYVLIQDYVWRKKAEAVIGRPLHFDEETSWLLYYNICSTKLLQKNLLGNHSGRIGRRKWWNHVLEGGDGWETECPPIGAPPPPISEPVFEGEEYCFVTSYNMCSKSQTVDLIEEGFFSQFLDEVQPPVTVSEWYCSRIDCPASYTCSAELTDESGKVLDTFHFEDTLEGERQNVWLFVEHEFRNYGPGLRKVTFTHGGIDKRFWHGHYGSKMAGACVKVDLPNKKTPKLQEADDQLPEPEQREALRVPTHEDPDDHDF